MTQGVAAALFIPLAYALIPFDTLGLEKQEQKSSHSYSVNRGASQAGMGLVCEVMRGVSFRPLATLSI
jgi:hypothetical protein